MDDEHFIALINENAGRIADALELNTEKVQELLERVECIDNQFDELKAEGGFQDQVVDILKAIHKQGTP